MTTRIQMDQMFGPKDVRLKIFAGSDKWVLQQRSGGSTVTKVVSKLIPVTINHNYHIQMLFNGVNFQVYVDGTLIIDQSAGALPREGNVGFRVQTPLATLTTNTFSGIRVF